MFPDSNITLYSISQTAFVSNISFIRYYENNLFLISVLFNIRNRFCNISYIWYYEYNLFLIIFNITNRLCNIEYNWFNTVTAKHYIIDDNWLIFSFNKFYKFSSVSFVIYMSLTYCLCVPYGLMVSWLYSLTIVSESESHCVPPYTRPCVTTLPSLVNNWVPHVLWRFAN